MVVTREHANGMNHYTINGEKVSRSELEMRCGKYLSVYGMKSMLNRLMHQNQVILEVDSAYTYAGLKEMYAEDELAWAKLKIAQLEKKLDAIQNACKA
ncbi:MAG: hypothetical protein IJU91_00910 [Selenomonadaceae bacterium]|nr:hypothetical protein [Selenomonadaceae bacterium]